MFLQNPCWFRLAVAGVVTFYMPGVWALPRASRRLREGGLTDDLAIAVLIVCAILIAGRLAAWAGRARPSVGHWAGGVLLAAAAVIALVGCRWAFPQFLTAAHNRQISPALACGAIPLLQCLLVRLRAAIPHPVRGLVDALVPLFAAGWVAVSMVFLLEPVAVRRVTLPEHAYGLLQPPTRIADAKQRTGALRYSTIPYRGTAE
jgi:hypothetical protein